MSVITHSRSCDQGVINELTRFRMSKYRGLDLGPGDVVLDLGAHIGVFTSQALTAGVEHVIAVEMLPETLTVLRRNHGQDPRVTIVPAAVVHDTNVTPVVTIRRYKNPLGASVSHLVPEAKQPVQVPTVSLDGLVAGYRPNKLKFDLVNSEYDVIMPLAEKLPLTGVQRLAGELYVTRDVTRNLARLLCRSLVQAGYETNKSIKQYPDRKHGWNVHAAWWLPN